MTVTVTDDNWRTFTASQPVTVSTGTTAPARHVRQITTDRSSNPPPGCCLGISLSRLGLTIRLTGSGPAPFREVRISAG